MVFEEENDGVEGSENGCLNLLAEVAMTQEDAEEDSQAPQNSEDKCEEDPDAHMQGVEEGEEGPQACEEKGRASQCCEKAGHGQSQQPSHRGKRKLAAAELQVWHPRQHQCCPCPQQSQSMLNAWLFFA